MLRAGGARGLSIPLCHAHSMHGLLQKHAKPPGQRWPVCGRTASTSPQPHLKVDAVCFYIRSLFIKFLIEPRYVERPVSVRLFPGQLSIRSASPHSILPLLPLPGAMFVRLPLARGNRRFSTDCTINLPADCASLAIPVSSAHHPLDATNNTRSPDLCPLACLRQTHESRFMTATGSG